MSFIVKCALVQRADDLLAKGAEGSFPIGVLPKKKQVVGAGTLASGPPLPALRKKSVVALEGSGHRGRTRWPKHCCERRSTEAAGAGQRPYSAGKRPTGLVAPCSVFLPIRLVLEPPADPRPHPRLNFPAIALPPYSKPDLTTVDWATVQTKQVAGARTLTYVAVLDEGEEPLITVDWAASKQLSAAQVPRSRSSSMPSSAGSIAPPGGTAHQPSPAVRGAVPDLRPNRDRALPLVSGGTGHRNRTCCVLVLPTAAHPRRATCSKHLCPTLEVIIL